MIRIRQVNLPALLMTALLFPAAAAADEVHSFDDVLERLNSAPTVQGRESVKSYKIIFDAYLDLTEPPMPVGSEFNQATIHPKMFNWDQVAGWAESNPEMAKAILECKDKSIFGLRYGTDGLDQRYIGADLIAEIAPDGEPRDARYPYLDAMDVIAAFVAAESYRLVESGQIQQGLDLAVAHLFLARQLCDREMLVEKSRSIRLLTVALANLRDMFYSYREKITSEQFSDIAISELPFLRPDRNAMFMPEGDRLVAEALLRHVFGSDGYPDVELFARTFGMVQSADLPMTRFGAVKRWRMIAGLHGSLTASLERLTLIYDDWWRRWRVQEYDPILDIPAQFARANAIRYAAVLYSLQDLENLFEHRKELIVAVNGTATAAGLCGYERFFGSYPADQAMVYAQFMRKSSDVDPYDQQYGPLAYFYSRSRHSIDTTFGRLWVERDNGILYSRGQNNGDDRARDHTDDGLEGDIVVWPPIKALAREQGRLQ